MTNSATRPNHQALEPLWKALTLANTVIPNRIMTSALTLQYGRAGEISDRHIAFYRQRAEGGVGLLFSEQLSATSLSQSAFSSAILAYEKSQVNALSRLTRALEPYPTRFFAQLMAAGAWASSTYKVDRWVGLRAPSDIGAPGGETPSPLTKLEINEIAADFRKSAEHVRDGGVHGIEIHGAHGYLVGQFLSPFYNRRNDEYGGSVENRCRFAIELGRAIREAVGGNFPVGIALSYDEFMGPAGITPDEALEQLRSLSEARVFNFFDLSAGTIFHQHYQVPSMSVPHGFSLPFGARAKQVVGNSAAIFVSGRVTDLELAAAAVKTGQADMVGMARAHLADPWLIRKTRSGAGSSVTRCVGINVCLHRAVTDQSVVCALNPATGRESYWNDVSRTSAPKHVSVIGGGPAGLRFATVAARAGHEVTLYERRPQLGGHLLDLAELPTRQEWHRAIEDMHRSLSNAGVSVSLGTEATVEGILKQKPDVIAVATGSHWDASGYSFNRYDRESVSGIDTTRCLGLDVAIERAIARGPANLGKRVAIFDGTGSYPAFGLADLLTEAGVEVVFVTPNPAAGGVLAGQLELPYIMPRLLERGMELLVSHDLEEVRSGEIVLGNVWGGPKITRPAIDTIVFGLKRTSNRSLYRAVAGRHPKVICIGDAVTPRSLEAVILEAESAARMIDSV